jgi:hypothetical protein
MASGPYLEGAPCHSAFHLCNVWRAGANRPANGHPAPDLWYWLSERATATFRRRRSSHRKTARNVN